MKTFIKEFQEKNWTDELARFYESEGCEIKYKIDSVEVWYNQTLEKVA